MSEKKSPFAPETFPNLPAIKGVSIGTAQSAMKYQGRDDLFLAALSSKTTAAGVFTRSKMPSAAVDWCRDTLALNSNIRAVLVNAGNANAFTGQKGIAATSASATGVANHLDIENREILLASTGVIGEPMDAQKLIDALPSPQTSSPELWHKAASAIMTTDTFPKAAGTTVRLSAGEVSIAAIAKGSGMIAPDMATMLSFIFTDADIDQAELQSLLQEATDQSFNCVTVDSDTSTSDTVLIFATAAANVSLQTKDDRHIFAHALNALSVDLARQIAGDGEGLSKRIEITVSGAENNQAARSIALSIANSPLVKTAIAGEDANWGRVVMAVGKSGEMANRDRLKISFAGIVIAKNGERVEDYDENLIAAHLKTREIEIAVDVGVRTEGGSAKVWSCDLTHDYIHINADYRS